MSIHKCLQLCRLFILLWRLWLDTAKNRLLGLLAEPL